MTTESVAKWNGDANLGIELINKEFKIVSLHHLIKHIPELVEKKIFTEVHDNLVHQSIQDAIEKYFAKYFSAMSRTKCEETHGKLYFGVNDYGDITGIPVTKKINENKISTIIQKIIKENIRAINNGKECEDTKYAFADLLKVNIYDVGDDICSSEDIALDDFLTDIEKEEKVYENMILEFAKELQEWRTHNKKYNVKLHTLSNEKVLRSELLEYCIEGNANADIKAMLESEDEIEIRLGVADRKYDDENFDYWVANFKEHKLNEKSRPYPPMKPSHTGRDRMIKCLNNPLLMREHWDDVHFQMIEIVLPMNMDKECWIEYMEGKDWVSRERRIKKEGDPYCAKI